MSVSVLVLTRNEEKNLPGCLKSVAWSNDVHVLDSLSTDRTVEIARSAGASVVSRAFDDWSSHQNWALANVPFRHPWVFYIDADERVTPELAGGVRAAVEASGGWVAFRVRRRDFFMGRWLQHAQAQPWYLRLFRPERMRYERLVNPTSVADGPVGEVGGFLDHYPFSKGLAQWYERHNDYSTLEARQLLLNRENSVKFSLWSAFFDQDFVRRRVHQKEFFYHLPARPLIRFLFLYVLKRGFLDGRAGLTYASLQAAYERMIVLKTREMQEGNGSEIA